MRSLRRSIECCATHFLIVFPELMKLTMLCIRQRENGRLCAGMQWLPTEKQRFLTDKYEGLTKEYKFLSQP